MDMIKQHFDNPPIGVYGFNDDTPIMETNEINIMRCVECIPILFKRIPCYKLGSYQGKHIVEKHLNTYISNGEFIIAMILSGYIFKKIDGLNCNFKAKAL